jgi:hypothetical protein
LDLPDVLQGPKILGNHALGESLHPPTELRVLKLAAAGSLRHRSRLIGRRRPQPLVVRLVRRPAAPAAHDRHLPGVQVRVEPPHVVVRLRRGREGVRGRGDDHPGGQAVGGGGDVGGVLLLRMEDAAAVVVGVDEVWHPEVAHGVLEALAVGVAVELLGVLLHPGPPVVLDLVVRPTRQVLRDLRPPGGFFLQGRRTKMQLDVMLRVEWNNCARTF